MLPDRIQVRCRHDRSHVRVRLVVAQADPTVATGAVPALLGVAVRALVPPLIVARVAVAEVVAPVAAASRLLLAARQQQGRAAVPVAAEAAISAAVVPLAVRSAAGVDVRVASRAGESPSARSDKNSTTWRPQPLAASMFQWAMGRASRCRAGRH